MHIGILKYQEASQLMGRHIVTQQFNEALFKYRGPHQVTLICPEAITEEHLATFLNEHPLDVLHHQSPDMYRAMDLKRLNPKPMVVTGLTHSLGHAPFMEWLRMTLLASPQASDALICTSLQALEAVEKMQDSLKIEPWKRLHVIKCPLGINSTEFYKLEKKNKTIELLYIGRLCPYTKADLIPLLEMVGNVKTKLVAEETQIHLTIAGSDGAGYAEVLLKKAKELGFLESEISIEKNISEERKKDLYANADIFLAPSNNTQETFGLTILEANAAGLPVIAYDWSGYRSLIRDGENGFLIPTALKPRGKVPAYQYDAINQLHFSSCVEVDRFQFETKLLVLITNEIFRKQMSETAFKIAESYDWKHIIPEFISLWERLLGRASYSVSALKTLDYFKVFSHYATNGATLAKNNVMNFINDAKEEPFDEKKILLIDGKPVKPGPYVKVNL